MDYAKLGAELYQIVRLAFLQSVAGNLLGTIQGEIEAGTATYAQALAFASDSGRILAALMREQMAPGVIPDDIMHAEIAENMITPLMTDQYALISEVCMQVQQNLNDRYGVNLAPQRPAFREERADGIARSVSGRPVNDIGPSFDNAVENYSMSVVDDSVRTNAEFQYEAGFEPQIIRTADAGACEWCQERAGTYEYARVRRKGSEVYRRHANCKCVVEFVPGNGRRQNVHDKTWRRETEEELNQRRGITIENTPQGYSTVFIDEFVPCLRDLRTGEIVQTTVTEITDRRLLKEYNKNTGWYEDWSRFPQEWTICALRVSGSEEIQGLVAYEDDSANMAIKGRWIVANPKSNGYLTNQPEYAGIGGHLFAIMAQASMRRGYGGFIEGMAANDALMNHYVEAFSAIPYTRLDFYINEAAAARLLEQYNWSEE